MLENLKEFERFLKICRKFGVTEITHQGIAVKLGDMPDPNVKQPDDEIEDGGLTPEQQMFYHLKNNVGMPT